MDQPRCGPHRSADHLGSLGHAGTPVSNDHFAEIEAGADADVALRLQLDGRFTARAALHAATA